MSGIDLSIIIVTFNSADSVTECIESIGEWTNDLNYEIIVVDNNSTDDTLNVLSGIQDIQIIPKINNFGFAIACNTGAATAQGRIVLFLNPDVYLEANSLKSAVDYLNKNKEVGVVGCRLLYPGGAPQQSFFKDHSLLGLISRYTKIYNLLPRNRWTEPFFYFYPVDSTQPVEVDWVLGANLFIRANVLKDLGGFDEGYFMYCEDTDLCLKVKERGYKVIGLPFIITHRFAGSSVKVLEKRIVYSRNSINRYMRSHFSTIQYPLGYLVVLLNVFFKMFLCCSLSLIKFWRFKTYWLKGKGYYNALFRKRF